MIFQLFARCVLVTTIVALPRAVPVEIAEARSLLETTYRVARNGKPAYVGRFKQYHKNSNKLGVGTVVLVAPSWALTAGHVVAFKINNPNGGKSEVLFNGGKIDRLVTKIYKAKGVDVALLKLSKPIGGRTVKPVAMMSSGFVGADGRIEFTSIGRSGMHRGRSGRGTGAGFIHSKSKDGTRPGKAGDSGGAWVIQRNGKPDVLFAIIHGGGRGPQVGPLRSWIDKQLQTNGEQATWVAKATVKK